MKNGFPAQQRIIIIADTLKGCFNDYGRHSWGSEGAHLLESPEVEAGTARAFNVKEAEAQARGDTLRMGNLDDVFDEANHQWREEFEKKFEQFTEEVRQRLDFVDRTTRATREQLLGQASTGATKEVPPIDTETSSPPAAAPEPSLTQDTAPPATNEPDLLSTRPSTSSPTPTRSSGPSPSARTTVPLSVPASWSRALTILLWSIVFAIFVALVVGALFFE